MISNKKRILFIAEAVTLAHVGRCVALAKSLDPSRYDVWLATDPRFNNLLGTLAFPVLQIRTIPSEQFLRALAKGSPLYSTDTLVDYVFQDLKLIDEIAPDIVIGDFRLSLNVSARLAEIPYICVTNAYWSPFAKTRYPVPEMLITKIFGVALAQQMFNLFRPLAFAVHAHPLNAVRRRFSLPHLGFDLRRSYTSADCTLYADISEVIPCGSLPVNHQYIGPVLWEPDIPLPDWWQRVPTDKPIVYVTMGSSGASELLPRIFQALAGLHVTVIAATAGRVRLSDLPRNVFVSDYLPGSIAAAKSQLVICNGGSPTAYQALDAGKPVLGIPINLDQHLNMWGVEQAGAGRVLRAGQATMSRIREVAEDILAHAHYKEKAEKLKQSIGTYAIYERFDSVLSAMLKHASK